MATSINFTPASPGTHRVIATYNGDANYNSSSSSCTDPTEAVVVNKVQPPNVPPIIGNAPGGTGGNIFGGGGNGGNAGPCGGGGGGAGGAGAAGGGAGGGGCFDVPSVQRLRPRRIVAFVGVTSDGSTAQASAFADLRGAGKATASRLTLIGQTTRRGLTLGRYKLSVRYTTKTRRALRRRRKATVRLRLRLSAPTGTPLILTRTVTLTP